MDTRAVRTHIAADGRSGELVIDRPARRNSMTTAMWMELGVELQALSREPDLRALVVRGARGAFVAGSDLDDLAARDALDGLQAEAQYSLRALAEAPFVTVAAVAGHAVGGGLELALACDLRFASADAVFRSPETTLAMLPAAGATQRLPGIVGHGRAAEMILTGRPVDAAEAERIGLVSRVTPVGEVVAAAEECVQQLAELDRLALLGALTALGASAKNAESGMAIERFAQALAYASGAPRVALEEARGSRRDSRYTKAETETTRGE